jgi:ankyrin repeat protein
VGVVADTDHLECGALIELQPGGSCAGATGIARGPSMATASASLSSLQGGACEPALQSAVATAVTTDKRGRTALHKAASDGDTAAAAAALEAAATAPAGGDLTPALLDATDRGGATALLRASEPGHLQASSVWHAPSRT